MLHRKFCSFAFLIVPLPHQQVCQPYTLYFIWLVCGLLEWFVWFSFFPNIDVAALSRGAFLMILVFDFSFFVISLLPKVLRFEFLYFPAHISLILLIGR